MRVGYHSPMPPAMTGVADYSAALVRALQPHCAVEINPRSGCDVHVYNIGNNPLHTEMHDRALRRPGVVLLHDALLQHFYLGYFNREEYVREFVYNYGEWNRGLAERLWSSRGHASHDDAFFRYPMLKRVIERSKAVIVHNPAAARVVTEHAPLATVVELPHLFDPPDPPSGRDVADLRESWPRFVFGVFGHLRDSKRIPHCLRAFDAVRRAGLDVGFLIAGQILTPELDRAIEPWLGSPGVIRVPYLPDSGFWLHAHAVDACLNLRYPTAAETSGIAIRLMGIGKPVIVTEGEETARFPEVACLRAPAGTAEHDALVAWMTLLATDVPAARAIGAHALDYIRRRHAPRRVGSALADVLRRLAGEPNQGTPSTGG